ncbi:helix-turn-helix domain-containing protein [Methylobacterium oryzisoli]|uniref:helix-turn-helix domain-containing protein n=1 Tax=Methylobacterium oryzisoli TaxID=3385502 RepID=UPI0038921C19
MAGYQPFATLRVSRDNRPSMPVVDRSLVERRADVDAFIPPPPVTPHKSAEDAAFERAARSVDAVSPVRNILRLVAHVSGVPADEIMGERRHAPIVKARQIAAWLANRHTKASLGEIARRLGGKDHTTILHAARRVDAAVKAEGLTISESLFEAASQLWAVQWGGKVVKIPRAGIKTDRQRRAAEMRRQGATISEIVNATGYSRRHARALAADIGLPVTADSEGAPDREQVKAQRASQIRVEMAKPGATIAGVARLLKIRRHTVREIWRNLSVDVQVPEWVLSQHAAEYRRRAAIDEVEAASWARRAKREAA